MSFSDFLVNWDQVQICHISADSYSDEVLETDDVNPLNLNKYTFEIKPILVY